MDRTSLVSSGCEEKGLNQHAAPTISACYSQAKLASRAGILTCSAMGVSFDQGHRLDMHLPEPE